MFRSRRAPLRRPKVAARGLAIFGADRQRVARLVERRPQLGQSGVPHQHQEPLLGKIAGLGRVESGRSVLDRIHPVTGDGLSDRKRRLR